MKLFKYILNLRKANKELTERSKKQFLENWDMKYYVSCVSTNYEGARGAMEQILKAETIQDAQYYAKIGLMYMDMRAEIINKMNNKAVEKDIKE